jgi:AraC-like DNA-binding protein
MKTFIQKFTFTGGWYRQNFLLMLILMSPSILMRLLTKRIFQNFIRIFKKTYRQTPHQYLVFVRLEKAKMLLQSAIPITEACYACGFESIPSFTTLFKKTTGLTPSEYRQQQLDLKADRQSKPLKYIPACFAGKKGWAENSNF